MDCVLGCWEPTSHLPLDSENAPAETLQVRGIPWGLVRLPLNPVIGQYHLSMLVSNVPNIPDDDRVFGYKVSIVLIVHRCVMN